jgi:Secretion system C-terminal sorting domain
MFDFGNVGDGSVNSTFLFDDVSLINEANATNETEPLKISIFPNPANGILFINGLTTQSDVWIYDLTGKMILNPQVDSNQIDISSLPTGFYSIKIKTPTGILTKKFVKE